MNLSKRFVRFSTLLVWLVSLGAGAFFPGSVALATPHSDGYSLTLSESASSMYYGTVSPTFQAFLTVPANEPPMPTYGITVVVDGTLSITGSITGAAPDYTLTVPASAAWGFEPGLHTIVAKYLSVPLNQYIYSQQLTFTVNKGNATLQCAILNQLPPYDWSTYPANASLELYFSVHNSYIGSHYDVDVQNATYTVIFVGAQTFTYANIKPAAATYNHAFIAGPSAPGNYTMRCIFNGSNLFSPTEADIHVTLQSTASTPSPRPTSTPASQQPASGSTPAGSGTHAQPGATATPTGTSTVAATVTATVTATAPGGLLSAKTTLPTSSHPSTLLLWTFAAVVVCSGAGGLGFLFWRKRRLPASLTTQPAIASNTVSTSGDAALVENSNASDTVSTSDESTLGEPEA